tara:strand:- start:195 stop:827 length:633 start_codon:yes stop_codon:yes gene_type:complete
MILARVIGMIYFRFLLILVFFSGVGACAYGPTNNVDFNNKISLKDLDGSYENEMETTENNLNLFSAYIWPYPENLQYKELLALSNKHKNIDLINISLLGSELIFEAIDNNCVILKKSINVHERFESGQFKLESSYSNWSEVHIGPNFNKKTIGLDLNDYAKLRSLDRAGGLAFWVIPFAIFESRDYRIKRVSEKHSFAECKTETIGISNR